MNIDDIELDIASVNILVPFSCNPENKYIAGTVFKDKSQYWYLQYGDRTLNQKWNNSDDVIIYLLDLVENDRLRMLNEEFQKSGI